MHVEGCVAEGGAGVAVPPSAGATLTVAEPLATWPALSVTVTVAVKVPVTA
jgi:hypothetical protein